MEIRERQHSPAPQPDRGPGRLWLYGVLMLFPAVGFAWRYPLPGNHEELVDLGKLAAFGVPEFFGYVGGISAMFVLYLLALRESRRLSDRRALAPVFGCGAALAIVVAWLYPVNAIDLFIYAVRSRVFTTHGGNPQAIQPREFLDDSFMAFASPEWADDVSPYGPLWNLIAAPITLISDDRILVALAGFKLLAVVSLLAGGWLITRVLATTRPEAMASSALFYLWNPLVLWEGIGNGHNDLVMIVPVLLAMVAWVRRWNTWVIPFLVVAALIKYVAILLVPIAAIALWQRADGARARVGVLLGSGVLSLLAAAIGFAPFYDIDATRASIAAQGEIFLTSPAAMALGLLLNRYPYEEITRWARWIGQGIVAVVVVIQALVLWRRPTHLPRAAFEIMFVFLLVATWNFRAWYLIWPMALAALLPWGWPAWRLIPWTAGGLAAYALYLWGWYWWGADFLAVQNVAVPLMFAVPLLLTLLEGTRWLLSRRRAMPSGRATVSPTEAASVER